MRYLEAEHAGRPECVHEPTTRTTYKSPITECQACGNNYVVLVGNTYPNAEPNNGGPTIFQASTTRRRRLSPVTSDTSRYADEWSYFLANTDVSDAPGVQRVFSYAINTYKDKPDADQGKLLKSMAAVGGHRCRRLPRGGRRPGTALIDGVQEDLLINIAAVDSVFTATTLPVSTTTQGTFLNQVFVGMFRPDANAAPRWVGNLKQYQLGVVNGSLRLVDKNGTPARARRRRLLLADAPKASGPRDSVFFSTTAFGHAAVGERPARRRDRRERRRALTAAQEVRSTAPRAATSRRCQVDARRARRLQRAAGVHRRPR